MKLRTNKDSRNQEKISVEKDSLILIDQDSCRSKFSLSFSTIGSRVLMEIKDI